MQETRKPGLRERQRRETLSGLHEAAFALVQEDGLAATTVEQIAARAGVSRRTFFNYYSSKEEAVLGLTPVRIPEDVLAAHDEDDADELTRTVRLLLAISRSTQLGAGHRSRRRELMTGNPELVACQRQHGHALMDLVLDALVARGADGSPPDEEALHRTRALVVLAGAVLRYAADLDPRVLDDEDPSRIDAAVSTFRTLLKEA